MPEDITIKLGDFEVIALDDPRGTGRVPHLAFIRYNGIKFGTTSSVYDFEIGRYFAEKKIQSGYPYPLPVGERYVNCRVDSYGRRVKLEITEASPLEIKAKDMTERQTVVDDREQKFQ